MFKETPRLKNEPSSLPKAQALGYTARKPKGPVLQNAKGYEVAAPTYKRGFVTLKFWAMHSMLHRFMVTGGMGISVRTAARRIPCFEHPVHLLRFKTQTVASQSRYGAMTMTDKAITNPDALQHLNSAKAKLQRAITALNADKPTVENLQSALGLTLSAGRSLKRSSEEANRAPQDKLEG